MFQKVKEITVTHLMFFMLLALLVVRTHAQNPAIPVKPNHYVLTEADPLVMCDAADAEVHILLHANPKKNLIVGVQKIDKSEHACVVEPNGSVVDKPSALTMNGQDTTLRLKFDGRKWRVQ